MTTDLTGVKAALATQRIETPSWAYGNSGTRFKVFGQPGVPRNAFEKVADAAQVHRHTGIAPSVALHIPWDKVDDYGQLAKHAQEAGIELGHDQRQRVPGRRLQAGQRLQPGPAGAAQGPGPPARVRRHHGRRPGPATSSCGSPTAPTTRARTTSASARTGWPRPWPPPTSASATTSGCVLEYKLFEPAFYHTDVPDWGTAYAHCLQLGPKAVVVVDTGHHAPGTNIEFIVAFLLRERKLGAFDFNSRFYADDDLMAGAADPFQLFRIMYEVIGGGGFAPEAGVCFMLDQCHNIERKIPGQIRSVMNVQELTAKALLVDRDALAAAQQAGDVLGANGALMDAFATDVRPLLADLRTSQGLDPDPMAAYARSGYDERIVADRVGGAQAGWGA